MNESFPRRLSALIASLLVAAAPAWAQTSLAELRAAAPAEVVSALATRPGSGIVPAISDPVRTKMILQLMVDIADGNPMRFPQKDGSVWTNKERSLPLNPDPSYYREYTLLPPPGSTSSITVGDRPFQIAPPQGTRGVERVIVGGSFEHIYYTPDHYATFIELTIVR